MQALRGTQDVLPSEIHKWIYIEKIIRDLCKIYGYGEIRTPMFEATELFQRGIGDTTDVVSKEMYTFNDRGGRSITLRPENTASAVRAFMEHKLYGDQQVHKFFYIGSMFRYDRPQAGRYREFHQFGVEILGSDSPMADVEVIVLAYNLFKKLGLNDLVLNINSIGDDSCRPIYRQKLVEFFESKKDQLCGDCLNRLYKNPLRLLDCKEESCKAASKDAPEIVDFLSEKCKKKFEDVKKYLTTLGIEYIVNPRLVRGLDYYTDTAFEIQYTPLGAQSAVCGGGRYDKLVEEMGGPSTPGIGFAVGLERLILALEMQGLFPEVENLSTVYIAVIGEKATQCGIKIQYELREKGINAIMDLQEKSLKGQMKQSSKFNSSYTLIIGDEEADKGVYIVKEMKTGNQKNINAIEVSEFLAKEFTKV